MGDQFKQILKQEIEESARKIEEEVRSKKSLDEVEVPVDKMRRFLAKEIREYEAGQRADAASHRKEETEIAEEIGIDIEEFLGKLPKEERESYLRWKEAEKSSPQNINTGRRKRRRLPMKKKAFLLVAASMVMVFGLGITSIGGKPYWMKVADMLLGNENTIKVNTEGEDRKVTTEVSEKEAYEEIKEKLGIEPIQIRYMPFGMEYYGVLIDERVGVGKVFYIYKDKLFQFEVYVQKSNFSRSVNTEDKVLDEYSMDIGIGKVNIKQILTKEEEEREFIAYLEDKNAFYKLVGR